MNADVIVIGAGIVSAACAHELVQAGLNVLVLDARFGSATNADCALSPCGTLWLASCDAEMATAEQRSVRLQDHGVGCELLNAAALAAAKPALRTGLAGALKFGSDSVVYAPCAARWLLTQSLHSVTFEAGEVTRTRGVRVQLSDGSCRSAGAVVLATGIKAKRLCPELPLRPKKGHLAIICRYPGTVHHQLVELGHINSAHHGEGTSVAFNVQPRSTGQLLIGSTRQFDTTDPAIEAPLLPPLLRCALNYLPGMADLNIIRTWTYFRAAKPDSLPIIGCIPKRDGLWLAVGHEGLGVTPAPATAHLLAAQFTGATLPFNADFFSPRRFQEVPKCHGHLAA